MLTVFKTLLKEAIFVIISIFLLSCTINSQEYLDTVIDRINTIETELKDIRGINNGNKNNLSKDNFSNSIASHEQRLVNIEEDIRTLNGSLDEINYKLEQLVESIKQIKSENTNISNLESTNKIPEEEQNLTENMSEEKINTTLDADPNIKKNPGMKVLGVLDKEKSIKDKNNLSTKENKNEESKESNVAVSKISEEEFKKLSDNPSDMYKYAYEMLVIENYLEAENAFKVFIGEHPKDTLTSNAYYWLGETYYVQKKFQLAAVSFARGYQNFPKGNKALDQLFKLSLTFMNMGKYEDACASFSKLEAEFPKAPKRINNRAKEYKKRAKC